MCRSRKLPSPMIRSDSQCQEPLGPRLGGPRADHDVGAHDSLPRPRRRALGTRSARPVRSSTPSAHGAVPPAPGCTALVDGLGETLIESSRDTLSGADGRSAAGSTMFAQCRSWRRPTSTTQELARVGAGASRPRHHCACEAVLVAPQPIVRGQLGYLRAGTSGAVPLRISAIRQTAAPSRRIAIARQSTGLSGATGNHHAPLRPALEDRDLFPLQGQVASRSGRQADRRHTTRPHDQRPPTGGGRTVQRPPHSIRRSGSRSPATRGRPGERI